MPRYYDYILIPGIESNQVSLPPSLIFAGQIIYGLEKASTRLISTIFNIK